MCYGTFFKFSRSLGIYSASIRQYTSPSLLLSLSSSTPDRRLIFLFFSFLGPKNQNQNFNTAPFCFFCYLLFFLFFSFLIFNSQLAGEYCVFVHGQPGNSFHGTVHSPRRVVKEKKKGKKK